MVKNAWKKPWLNVLGDYMALKNFVCRVNWMLSEVVGMKISFFFFFFLPFWTQPGPTFWPQNAQIWNSLNRILIFNPLERQKLYYYQVCELKTD